MDILGLTFFILFMIIFFFSLFVSLRLIVKNRKLKENLLQQNLDNKLLVKKINDLLQQEENRKLESSDGFVRFLSESRDWAFNYIEDTQDAIEEFSTKMDTILNYFDKYGQVLGENPHTKQIDEISQAYLELKGKVMPEEIREK